MHDRELRAHLVGELAGIELVVARDDGQRRAVVHAGRHRGLDEVFVDRLVVDTVDQEVRPGPDRDARGLQLGGVHHQRKADLVGGDPGGAHQRTQLHQIAAADEPDLDGVAAGRRVGRHRLGDLVFALHQDELAAVRQSEGVRHPGRKQRAGRGDVGRDRIAE